VAVAPLNQYHQVWMHHSGTASPRAKAFDVPSVISAILLKFSRSLPPLRQMKPLP
jgi:hypothetical protein